MSTIVGIDLGKFKSVFCIVNPETDEIRFLSLPTGRKAFALFLAQEAPAIVLFETCTAAGWVSDLCRDLGLKFAVANPLGEAWQWHKVRRKTDRDDAHKFIRLYLLKELPTVHVPPPETREHRALIAFRQHLIERRTAVCNHIRALFQAQGLELPQGRLAWSAQARVSWMSAAQSLPACSPLELWRGILQSECQLLEALECQIKAVGRKLDTLAKSLAGVQWLTTIPGVGTRTAEAVVAYLGDPHRFQNSRQVSAYAGLVPRQFQSGTMDRKGRITKRGPRYLRKILVQCAWLMLRYNSWAAEVVERISRGQKGRRKAAVVALARKLLVRCWAMLKKGEPWKEHDLSPVAA